MIVPLETNEEKILKINKIKKCHHLYQLFFSDEKVLLCDETMMFEYSLFLNKTIASTIVEMLESKQEYFRVLNRSLQIINHKFYTIKQVSDKLKAESYELVSIDLVIVELVRLKILDDDLYYEDYVSFKTNQGYGPLYIKNKLHQLGIDCEVYLDHDVQYETLKSKANKLKINKDVNLIKKSFKTKMKNQGFDVTIIEKVLSEMSVEKDETYLRKDYEKLLVRYQKKYDEKQLIYVIKKKLYEKGYEIEDIEIFLRRMI